MGNYERGRALYCKQCKQWDMVNYLFTVWKLLSRLFLSKWMKKWKITLENSFFTERLDSTAKQCQNELSVGHRSAKSDIHDFLFDKWTTSFHLATKLKIYHLSLSLPKIPVYQSDIKHYLINVIRNKCKKSF